MLLIIRNTKTKNMIKNMTKTIATTIIAAGIFCGIAFSEEKPADSRLYELRVYHAEAGKLDDLLSRFRDHTVGLFEKAGMTNVGYWVPVENKDNLLIYLLSYPDRGSRDDSWKKFLADEDWKKAFAASRKDGPLVGKIDQLFLTSTDFSPGFSSADGNAERLFEMRTYTTPEKGLAAIKSRFRDHTVALFAKHGITNLGYFQLAKGQAAEDETLLYFIAHKDADAAAKSWDDFRKDPAWAAAKNASEEKAGGSLTVPDGVKSVYLKPTDFSPVQ